MLSGARTSKVRSCAMMRTWRSAPYDARLESRPQRMKPTTILVGALGGDGGGVLCDWIVAAAQSQGLAVQATQIPGVAQRTGATTYYLEVMPTRAAQPSVLALNPGDRRGRRGAGDRAPRSRPHDLQRLRDARPHHLDRLDASRAGDRRAHGDGRRQLRRRPSAARGEGTQQGADPVRHGSGGRGIGRRDQRRAAGRAGGLRPAADSRCRLRDRDPPWRQGRRHQPRGLRLRPRPCARRARPGRARASQAAGRPRRAWKICWRARGAPIRRLRWTWSRRASAA